MKKKKTPGKNADEVNLTDQRQQQEIKISILNKKGMVL